jgi:acyl carrier protein
MDEIQNRLSKCFESVFPDLPVADIPASSQKTVGTWDSIAAITLVNVIEDEFGLQMDFDRLAELDSFDRILSYVRAQVNVNAGE